MAGFIIIKSKPWWMSQEEFLRLINKASDDIASHTVTTRASDNVEEANRNTNNPRLMKQRVLAKKISPVVTMIRQLKEDPAELGEIRILHHLITVLGHWADELNRNPSEQSLRQFLAVLENHYQALITNEVAEYYYLDGILLLEACPKHLADKPMSKALDSLSVLFSDEKIRATFLRSCPHAATALAPLTLQRLAAKNISDARIIFIKPALKQRVGLSFVTEFFGKSSEKLTSFIKDLEDPAEFLIEHRDWITGEHLLDAMLALSEKRPAFAKDYLNDYLQGKKDSRGNRPIRKLTEQIRVMTSVKNNINANVKIVRLLQNNAIRGQVNLSGNDWLKWARYSGFNPSVCQLMCKGRELYAKTNIAIHARHLPVYKNSSPYLKAYYKLQEEIDKEDGGFWDSVSKKRDNYFAKIKKKQRLDSATCFIIANHDRYWRYLAPAPASKGYFWGLWGSRTQKTVNAECRALARKHPIFADKLSSKDFSHWAKSIDEEYRKQKKPIDLKAEMKMHSVARRFGQRKSQVQDRPKVNVYQQEERKSLGAPPVKSMRASVSYHSRYQQSTPSTVTSRVHQPGRGNLNPAPPSSSPALNMFSVNAGLAKNANQKQLGSQQPFAANRTIAQQSAEDALLQQHIRLNGINRRILSDVELKALEFGEACAWYSINPFCQLTETDVKKAKKEFNRRAMRSHPDKDASKLEFYTKQQSMMKIIEDAYATKQYATPSSDIRKWIDRGYREGKAFYAMEAAIQAAVAEAKLHEEGIKAAKERTKAAKERTKAANATALACKEKIKALHAERAILQAEIKNQQALRGVNSKSGEPLNSKITPSSVSSQGFFASSIDGNSSADASLPSTPSEGVQLMQPV